MPLRLFAAFPIPDGAAARLAALQTRLAGAKWRPRENLHLTLHFFGDVPEAVQATLDESLAEIAAQAAPLTITLTEPGAFGGANPHALIVRAQAEPALERLAGACRRAARRLGLAAEARKYAPHVTLAYLSGAHVDEVMAFQQRHSLMAPIAFRADAFTLFSSWTKKNAPNLYRPEASYPLGA